MLLATVLALLSPGPQAATVFAQTLRSQAGNPSPVSLIPGTGGFTSLAPAGYTGLPGQAFGAASASAGLPSGVEAPRLSTLRSRTQGPAAAAQALAHPAPAPAATALLPVAAVLNRGSVQALPQAPAAPSARDSLEAVTQRLEKSEDASERQASFSLFYHGERPGSSSSEEYSSEVGVKAGHPAAALSASSLDKLEADATDSSLSEAERKEAVSSIAKAGGEAAKAALGRVAENAPEGGAVEYEVHRAALRALALSFGEIRSLRPVSREHAKLLLERLSQDKPELAFFDYDDTLSGWAKPASPEIGAALKAASDAGVETAILTDRPDEPEPGGRMATILESLDTLTPAQKAAITVQSSRGTRTLMYDRAGKPALIRQEDARWTEAEKTAIQEAARAVWDRFGKQEFPAGSGTADNLGAYSYSLFLPVGLSREQVREAASLMNSALKAKGVDHEAAGRLAKNASDPAYLNVSKVDKSIGVLGMRARRGLMGRLRDLARLGLSSAGLRKAARLLERIPGKPVAASKTLVVGDQFFGARTVDKDMLKGAPGALALSVGGTADPRLDNVFVWPSEGAQASLEILGALGSTAPSGMDKKAVFGLFAQRTVSIGVFILTSIAYPFLAVPTVGWAGYGALMALGPLAAIATGPLSGFLVDRLSARNAMALNTAIRVVLNLALPLFALAGILNFWTLLIASFANGWLLSSVMITEGAYVKRLAGPKYAGAVNGLAWMNYLGVQVALGLIVGVGSLIDQWNPNIAFYLSAAAHAFLVLPIVWFTMPSLSPKPEGLGERGPSSRNFLSSRYGLAVLFIKKYWKEALLLGASAALYAYSAPLIALLGTVVPLPLALAGLLKSTLPIAGALLYWVSRTEGFRDLWNGTGREPSDEEKALERRIRENRADRVMMEAELKRLESEKPAGWEEEARRMGYELAAKQAEDKSLSGELHRSRTRLRSAMLYIALSALLLYPLQYFSLPLIAEVLVGKAGKGLLLGNLLGSLFFGNLIANSAQARLPDLRLPLIGRVPIQRFIQAGVSLMAGAWVFTRLLPGSLLAAAAAALGAAGLIALAGRLTNRGWIKLFGAGFAAVWLPYVVWAFPALLPFLSVPAAMMISLLAIGMFYGPAFVSLTSYFQANAKQGSMGRLIGSQGSFTNTAISVGYGLISMAAALMNPALPSLLALIGAAAAAGGLLFWFAPRYLPGLPSSMTEKKPF